MKRLLLTLAALAALWTAACSNGGGSTVLPPPAGKFSAASLNGTYAFITNGEVITNTTATQLARVGSFIADGQGNIKGGIEDSNLGGTSNTPASITGGSYTVTADGRGTLTLNFAQNSLQFGITLTSITDGLMIDETSNGNQLSTGSGNFINQDTTLCSNPANTPAGAYVFDLSGLDGSGGPESIVGEINANTGVLSAGFADVNDNGATNSGAITSGSLVVDNSNPQA